MILNSTAATAASMLPAFTLHFDHFISPLIDDLALQHRFAHWFEADAPIFKSREAAGQHHGYYSPALADKHKFELRGKNTINSLHVKYSSLPHIMSAQLQLREDAQTLNAPALGTHWTQNTRHSAGTLPIHDFKHLAEMSCATLRKYLHSPADRLAAAQQNYRAGALATGPQPLSRCAGPYHCRPVSLCPQNKINRPNSPSLRMFMHRILDMVVVREM